MPSFGKTVVTAAAAMALVQFCPAPFLAAIPAATAAGIGAASAAVSAAAAVGGTVVAAIKDRSVDVEEEQFLTRRGVSRVQMRQEQNQQAWNDCHSQLTSAHVTFSAPEKGDILVKGIPSACMTLATVITGHYNAGNPIPEGSDSILFQNLSNDDIQSIQDALDAHPKKI
ncbi:hypothetical protein GGR52DRAFT_576748 [Hypoxylon sp. FL1284]|nr:hypothetical protein GGR52DRAFT_576748 [Hypoxylon sp. FL1284]